VYSAVEVDEMVGESYSPPVDEVLVSVVTPTSGKTGKTSHLPAGLEGALYAAIMYGWFAKNPIPPVNPFSKQNALA
jgi:hypothetical protein